MGCSSAPLWGNRTSNLTDVMLLISANFSGKSVGTPPPPGEFQSQFSGKADQSCLGNSQ